MSLFIANYRKFTLFVLIASIVFYFGFWWALLVTIGYLVTGYFLILSNKNIS